MGYWVGTNLEEVFRLNCVPHPINQVWGVKMDDPWKGTEYMTCPKCKQVIRREDIANGTHSCNFIPKPTLGIWED